MKKYILIIISALAMLACTEDIDFRGTYPGEKLVLYSCAMPDSVLRVELYKSCFFMKKQDSHSYDAPVDSKVWVEARGKSWPMILTENGYISDYKPIAGEEFTVCASATGFEDARGSCIVPQAPAAQVSNIINMEIQMGEYFYQRELHATITIDDPASEQNYYMIGLEHRLDESNAWDESLIGTWVPFRLYSKDILFSEAGSMNSLESIGDEDMKYEVDYLDDSSLNGSKRSFEVWATTDGWSTFTFTDESGELIEHEIPVYNPEDYRFTVSALSRDMYLYLKSLKLYDELGGGIISYFMEPVSIHSNVLGGIGCIGAMSR